MKPVLFSYFARPAAYLLAGLLIGQGLPALAENQTVAPAATDSHEYRQNLRGLFQAAQLDNPDQLREIAKSGFDMNLRDVERGETALMFAIREDANRSIAALLAMPQVDLEARAKNGNTALMLAAYKGNLSAVQALIARGAAVNQTGWTALHYAALAGHQAVVALLLERAAYIDATTPNQSTPIMLAAYGGHIHVVKLLLDEGADLSLKNERGQNAIDLARMANHQDIVEGLQYQLKKRSKP